MAFSQYFATQVLSWVKGAPFPTALSNVYISLHSADPGVAGTNADETAAITNTANRTTIASSALGAVSGASGGGFEITNTGVVQLTTSANNSNAITVTHFGVWDAASGGNFLLQVNSPRVLTLNWAIPSSSTSVPWQCVWSDGKNQEVPAGRASQNTGF